MKRYLGRLSVLLTLAGCRIESPAPFVPFCTGSSASLQGRVFDSRSGAPLAGALIAIEVGGLYQHNTDTSKGNPSYQYGTQGDADGGFAIDLPCGQYGVHAYADGYRYGSQTGQAGETLQVACEHWLPSDPIPTLAAASLAPAMAASGQPLSVAAQAHHGMLPDGGDGRDPLSEEVLLVAPGMGISWALDPPAPGVQGSGYPDGQWSRSFAAPATPGDHRFYLLATSEGCITSLSLPLDLNVQ